MGMARSLRTRYLKALELACATLGDIADGLGLHYRSLQAHKRGERGVSADTARRLAAYLNSRARAFNKAAEELEAAADKEEA
ncbi:hypothetical protein BH18GEM1_BH18GEM1_08260 [soil metagenome]